MTHHNVKTPVARQFLKELLRSLDIESVCHRLGLTRRDARSIIEHILQHLPEGDEPLSIYVDGASRGNPGPAGVGIVVMDSKGRILKKVKKNIGTATNNVAEYTALIEALRLARSMGKTRVEVFSDSELLVRQINGEYGVRSPALRLLYERARCLIEGFCSFRITHISRARNTLADELANEAIDGI